MKKALKRLTKTLFFLLILASGVKAYLEIDNYFYQSKLEKMISNSTTTKITQSHTEHKTLSIDKAKIHYYVSGQENKNTIVFLHAAFSDHSAFNHQVNYFSEKYRVITVDLIGHGLSKANNSKDKIDASSDHILNILKLENVDQIDLVGVSLGSLIAQYFTLNHPEKVKTLTALGGYNINKTNKEIESAQRSTQMGLIFRAIFSLKSFRKKTSVITCYTIKGQALFYETMKHFERKSFMAMQGLENIVKDRKRNPIYHPTLILTGEYDIELAKKISLKWHSETENCEFKIIQNAGHCANLDEPIIFNKLIEEFITKNKHRPSSKKW